MFTGIITDIGEVKRLEKLEHITKIWLSTNYDLSDITIGASIACNGCCLTVVSKEDDLLEFDISPESLYKTNFSEVKIGSKINLERPLKFSDELGGHIVTGHVDALAEVVFVNMHKDNWHVRIKIPREYSKFIAQKGSVTLNGVSLTVNDVENNEFEINIIPHTLRNTNLGEIVLGSKLNFEVDLLARYVSKQI